MAREYGFDERLEMSEGVCDDQNIAALLVARIRGAVAAHRSHVSNDRTGVDWWVELESQDRHLGVDVKARAEDYALRGADDYALETWSVVEDKVPGWTRDALKKTDYILFFWAETGRFALVPFRLLLAVFEEKWELWSSMYRTAVQRTTGGRGRDWHSQCVFVPRRVVWGALYEKFSGHVPKEFSCEPAQGTLPGIGGAGRDASRSGQ